jgi:DNA-binding IclR family transcriptional regulator
MSRTLHGANRALGKDPAMPHEPKVETRALDRGLQLLSSLAASPDGFSAPELAEMNELNRATVYRLLSTLGARHYVVQDEDTRRYTLGPAVETWFLGRESRIALAALAKPAMQAVAEATEETVGLFVRNGMHRICISRIDSKHVLRHVRRLGELRPLVMGSSGIVLMWQMSDEVLGQVLDFYDELLQNEQMTPDEVREAIIESRDRGYAMSSDVVPGLASVALPVIDMGGRLTAALTVTGPNARYGAAERRNAVAHLREACREIADQAYRPF